MKSNYLSIIGIIIGIMGVLLTFLFFRLSISSPEVVLWFDPLPTQIVNSAALRSSSIRVIRPDGSEVNADVKAVRFYLWNRGRKAIRSSDVLRPLAISLHDHDPEVLDCSIIKCSRDVVNPRIGPPIDAKKAQLMIAFDVLDHDDYFLGEIIYAAHAPPRFAVSGSVIGMKRIVTNEDLRTSALRAELGRRLALYALTFLCILGFSAIAGHLLKDDPLGSKVQRTARRFARVVIIGLIIGYLAIAILDTLLDSSRSALVNAPRGIGKSMQLDVGSDQERE